MALTASQAHRRRRHIRTITSAILAYILTFACTGLVLVGLVFATVANAGYLQQQMVASNYVAQTQSEVTAALDSYGAASGLGSSYFSTHFDTTQLNGYLESEAARIYGPSPTTFDKATFQAQLTKQLEAYAKVKQIALTSTTKKAITRLAGLAASRYDQIVALPAITTLNSAMGLLRKILVPALLFFAVIAALDVAVLFRLRPRHRKAKAFRYIDSALVATGLVFLVSGLLLLGSGLVSHVAISSQALYGLVVAYCNGIFTAMIASGAVIVIIGIAAAAVFVLLRKRSQAQA
jgi:hypothetical protein